METVNVEAHVSILRFTGECLRIVSLCRCLVFLPFERTGLHLALWTCSILCGSFFIHYSPKQQILRSLSYLSISIKGGHLEDVVPDLGVLADLPCDGRDGEAWTVDVANNVDKYRNIHRGGSGRYASVHCTDGQLKPRHKTAVIQCGELIYCSFWAVCTVGHLTASHNAAVKTKWWVTQQ